LKAALAAFILVFVTAVTAGFVFYQFASNLTERMKTTFPVQTLQLESYSINETYLTVRIRSFASANVQVTEVYVDEKVCNLKKSITISPSEIGVIDLYGIYVRGKAYVVKIYSGLGLPLVFNVEYE
jgi:hypothetical protein